MNHLTALTALADVAPLAAEPTLNTAGIVGWIIKYVIPILFAIAGTFIVLRFATGKGQTGEAFKVGTGLIIGLIIIAMGGVAFRFADQIADFVFA